LRDPSSEKAGFSATLAPFALALGAAGALITLIALSLDWVGISEPNRWARRALVPLVILLSLALCPRFGIPWRRLLFGPDRPPRFRTYLRGFLIGVSSLALLNLGLWATGFREPEPEGGPGKLALKLLGYLGSTFILALMEETFFRGLWQGALLRALRPGIGITLGAFLFGVAHFFRPPKSLEGDRDPWRVAWDCLLGVPEAFGPRWRELVGLVLVGLVLGVIAWRSKSIWLGMGIHAGWVFVRQSADKLIDDVEWKADQHLSLVGTMRNYDGWLGWGALLLALALAEWSLRRRPAGRIGSP
jgi:membrane protease YdiL (CAAX protease family)